jgi:hypothetical protein
MEISLKSIYELHQYINVYVYEQSTYIDVRIINKIANNKPNYQLHCSNKSVITMDSGLSYEGIATKHSRM